MARLPHDPDASGAVPGFFSLFANEFWPPTGEENGFQLVISRGPVERGVVGTVLGRMGVVL